MGGGGDLFAACCLGEVDVLKGLGLGAPSRFSGVAALPCCPLPLLGTMVALPWLRMGVPGALACSWPPSLCSPDSSSGMVWGGVVWRSVVWRGVVWRGVVWCDAAWLSKMAQHGKT